MFSASAPYWRSIIAQGEEGGERAKEGGDGGVVGQVSHSVKEHKHGREMREV